jgi:Tol biopolymer transport system component
MSDQVFYNVEKVNWGKASDKAILEYPDGSNILYDFQTQKQVTLPKHWEDFNFAPQDERIVAKSIGTSEENRFLVTSNPDGTNAKLIEELGRNQDKVHTTWSPNNQVIAYSFTGQPLGFDRQEVLLVGQNHENFKGLVVEGRGLQPKWSPTGNNLVYSVYSAAEGFRPTLWFSGASGDSINANRRNLNLQTWAEKCAFQSESTVICAVPNQLGEGAGLQPGLFVNNPDSIYRIDLETGQSINLGAPEGNRSINQLVISPDGQYVYFNDNISGQVIRYEL